MAAVGIGIAATAVASANAAPSLPPRTAAQLLADLAQGTAKPLGPMTATIQQTANLGLPQLPAAVQNSNPLVLGGSQSVNVWYSDPQHLRVAEPVQAGESDLRVNGRTVWLWNSKTQTATRVVLPADVSGYKGQAGNGAASPSPSASPGTPGTPGGSVPPSPQAAARQILDALGPSTVVSVQSNAYVAGQAAYELSLAPKNSGSLIGQVVLAIDASRDIPLQVQVFARSTGDLAYSIGYSSLTFGEPAASNFSFTPPPGAKVKKVTVPSSAQALAGQGGLGSLSGLSGLGLSGPGLGDLSLGLPVTHLAQSSAAAGSTAGLQVSPGPAGKVPAMPKKVRAEIAAQFAKSLPASMSKAARAKAIKAFEQDLATSSSTAVLQASTPSVGGPAGGTVLGRAWLSVYATPPDAEVAAAVRQLLNGSAGGSSTESSSLGLFGSSSQAASAAPNGKVQVGQDLAVLRTLLQAATPVHGSWGSGRLLQTTLLSVLVTSKGQILAGAVTPDVLYGDVAADAG